MSDEWKQPETPPAPLFTGKKERDLVKKINDEIIERVIGQTILYYPISMEHTSSASTTKHTAMNASSLRESRTVLARSAHRSTADSTRRGTAGRGAFGRTSAIPTEEVYIYNHDAIRECPGRR